MLINKTYSVSVFLYYRNENGMIISIDYENKKRKKGKEICLIVMKMSRGIIRLFQAEYKCFWTEM